MDYDLPDGGTPPETVEDASPSTSTTAEPPGSEPPTPDPTPAAVSEALDSTEEPEAPPAATADAEVATPEHAVDVPADLAPVEDLITEGEPASATRPLPRVIAIANQKGGVGKTTTAVNLGACLAEIGYRTLVVDLDPQGNASTGLGINPRALEASMYDVLLGETPMEDCIEGSSVRNLFVAPASLDLAGAEIELVPAFSRELRLRNAIDSVKEDYDYVLIDCPPSLGLLTINAFAAATEVLVPIQCEYYALEGLGQLVRNVDLVKRNLNDRLEISTIILVMYDARTKLADQVAAEVREHFGEKVCRQIVPRTVRLSEAPSFGQPIITFDPSSRGSIAYRQLAKEVSGGPS
jgi:chromosome partitioning protein